MEILSREEELRYNRQIVLRNFDFDGQEALKQARVLVLGAGGLGCAASQYLAAAGVGRMTLVDFDTIELSNLQRQILHRDARIGEYKSQSARQELQGINPHLVVDALCELPDDARLSTLVSRHDLALDCTDNLRSREQINRICARHKKPLVSGAAIRMEGQICVFTYQSGEPCYQCLSRLFGAAPLSCVESGIIAPMVGIVGSIQALEALKVIAGFGQPLTGKLLMIDGMTMSCREMKLSRRADCEVCRDLG